jgi:hypothetical protein
VTRGVEHPDRLIHVAFDLEQAGLLWHPEIGDEVADREGRPPLSILVDPQGMTPSELRSSFVWIPTVEQLIQQFEVRQAVLFHAGVEMSESSFGYKIVIQASRGHIQSRAESLRVSLGLALRNLLVGDLDSVVN